ncbi:MAG: (d)CMP kinase, partial [Candidatus Krumholzibacteriota bacterium]|nr:(d)CMP kinase [Candidatus Krumholzibacteriota bacterium]
LRLSSLEGRTVFLLEGRDIEQGIRGPEVSRAVSPLSRHAGVRRAMVRLQRKIAAAGGIVADGRDTGSVVFPYAQVKVFLVADLETRAARRKSQLRAMNIEQDIDEIRENIQRRDEIDSSRENSPLLRPPGAMVVDTSSLTIEEQVDLIEDKVRREARRLAELEVHPGERNPRTRKKLYYAISHALLRSIFKILFGLTIEGKENLNFRENFIFASNHISYADPPLVGSALNQEIWFFAKKELFRNRFFAWLIRTYHAIPVNRDEVDRESLKTVMGKLKGGESVLLFPEGTRSRGGEIGEMKSGLGFIALHTGVSILPLYVSGSDKIRDCFWRKRKLRVRLGMPIRIDSNYKPEDRKRDYQVLTLMVREEMGMLRDETEA